MKHYKIETKVETKKFKQLKYIQCDICEKQYKEAELSCFSDAINWDKGYSRNETSLSFGKGYSCPDGGHFDNYTFDICPDCFQKEIVDYLKEKFKIEPHLEEVDY